MPVLINPSRFGVGGGGTPSVYVGYNAPGGSLEAITRYRVYASKITLASDGLLASIGAYLEASATDTKSALVAALFEDNAGTPRAVLASSGATTPVLSAAPGDHLLLEASAGATVARWVHVPLGIWLTAGDYWLAVMDPSGAPGRIAYDSGGSDRTYTSGRDWFADWGFYTPTTGSNHYSIRAEVMT